MVSRIGVHRSVESVFPPERLAEALSDIEPAVAVVDDSDVADCDAVVTLEHREAFLDVEWIHSIQAGVDRFPFDELEARGVALTNSTGIHGTGVGETAVGYMLMHARRLHAHVANQQRREWRRTPWDEAYTLRGETVCVVGLGTLGRGIAVRAAALGMDVAGVRRTPVPTDGVDRVYGSGDLREAIADARFVALAVPLISETRGLVGAAELEAMREDGVLINVARGEVVDEAALVEALRAGEIAGAALDVFEEEPLPPDSPLWDMDDVIVTPHSAGQTRDYYRNVAALVRENARRVAGGDAFVNRVV